MDGKEGGREGWRVRVWEEGRKGVQCEAACVGGRHGERRAVRQDDWT